MAKAETPTRSDYVHFAPITTRWMDNDMFGHVNNVTYYSYFDTIANGYLIERGGFKPTESPTVGYIVSSSCAYHQSIAFPDEIEGGFRVNRLGNSSVEYGVAIFKRGENVACAHGTMTHVFVDRITEKPQPITGQLRASLEAAQLK